MDNRAFRRVRGNGGRDKKDDLPASRRELEAFLRQVWNEAANDDASIRVWPYREESAASFLTLVVASPKSFGRGGVGNVDQHPRIVAQDDLKRLQVRRVVEDHRDA